MGDAPQLEQAFLNLILNAAQAMPDGSTLLSSRLRISFACTRAHHPTHIAIEFKDTGTGMSTESQKRYSPPF